MTRSDPHPGIVGGARRTLAAIAAVAAVGALLVPAGAVPAAAAGGCETAVGGYPITRIAGSDRYATAACVSASAYPDGAPVVLVARGDDEGGFADALAATPLAAQLGGPILLAQPHALPDVTRAAIEDLAPARIRVLGGTASIDAVVFAQLRSLADDTERIAGEDRFGTAAAIAEVLGGDTAFLVSGYQPADALSAGAAAARAGAALLLTRMGDLPASTAGALAERGMVTIVGGDGSVSEEVAQAIRDGGATIRRLSGPDRFETAASVARAHPGAGRPIAVAGRAGLVDALAAGWLAALPDGGPVIYLERDEPGRGTDRYLRLGALAGAPALRVVGGDASVSDAALQTLQARYDEAAAGGPAPQMRALWVHLFDTSLKTRSGIRAVLDAAVKANLNTVVVQVARRHDAFYDSDVLPATTDETFAGDYDLLAELVPAAHARGLAVHAWWATMPTTHTRILDNETVPPEHIYAQHGPDSADPWIASVSEPTYAFLDPAIPGVQTHVVDMIREVVQRYDVDGVHLDYLRYEGIAGDQSEPRSEHPMTEQRYADTGLAGETMRDFLRRQTRDLARRIYVEVADVDPTVVVSAALIAQGAGPSGDDLRAAFTATKAYAVKAQDWPSWIDEGIVDDAFPMAYFRERNAEQATWWDQWAAFAESLTGRGAVVALGQAGFLNCPADSLTQIADALARTDGVALYSYQGDAVTDGAACPGSGQGDLLAALPAGLFADPAPTPVADRKVTPTRGHLVVDVADGTAVVLRRGSETLTIHADATGHAVAVWLAPGSWEVSADGHVPTVATVTAGDVTRVTLATA